MVYDNAIRTGDYVEWEKPIFSGGRFNRGRYAGGAKFIGTEKLAGKVVRHSYGANTGQHTFSIETADGLILVKGRNLYPNITKHTPDENSPDRADSGKVLLR